MNYEPYPQYSHVDQELVDRIVCKLKSQGIFDRFRKDCLADVDTKPAYQNLQQRVNGTVANFLGNHKWKHDLNKNQLRENLRRHVQQDFLEVGVSRIVEQVVNPKICPIFLPQVEDVVYNCLGLEKPKPKRPPQGLHLPPPRLPVKRCISPLSLLPLDLDPISPESDHLMDDDSFNDNNGNKDESRTAFLHTENISNDDSHLSGISELTSHGSIKDLSEHACMSEKSNIIADQTSNDVPNNNSSSHKVFTSSEKSVGSDFDNFSNLQEKLKKTDHLCGNSVKKEVEVVNDEVGIRTLEQNTESDDNKSCLSTLPRCDDLAPCKRESPIEVTRDLNSSENDQKEVLKLDIKKEDLPPTNNGLIISQNEASSEVVCIIEKPDESASYISKCSEDSHSSDSLYKDKKSELKQNGAKVDHKKYTENGDKYKHSKEDKNRYKNSSGSIKQKNETDSEYTSSDKDQKSDYNSSDKEVSIKHVGDSKLANNIADSKKCITDSIKENKETKSADNIPKSESPNKADKKSSSSSHHSSTRDKKSESSRDHKSRESKHEKDRDSSRHRSSDKKDESKDRKHKEKSSQDGKKNESKDEKEKQKFRKERPLEGKDVKTNMSNDVSTKSKDHKSKDDQVRHDKDKHKSSKSDSKDRKEKSSDKKEHNRHKEDGEKRDKDKNKDKDDKQRSSKDHRTKHHDKGKADNYETRKTAEAKGDNNQLQKLGNEDKNINKKCYSNSDALKRSSSSNDKTVEKDDRSKAKERSSKKRKGERCKEEVKPKEARRSTDRDSNGRGNGSLVDKGTQQGGNKTTKNINSGDSQALEGSSNGQNSCSDSVQVPNNEVNTESQLGSPVGEGLNDIDLILQKINSSIEEGQNTENLIDEVDSVTVPSDASKTDMIQMCPVGIEASSLTSVKKPKIAKNIFEIRKIMQARKNIDRKRRNDVLKHGLMNHRHKNSEGSQNEAVNAVSVIVKHSTANKTANNSSLDVAAVNENVDSNNFVEKRECSSKTDGCSLLKNDSSLSDSVLIKSHESGTEENFSEDELFRGFNDTEISIAVQKLSKVICYRSQTHVRLSPLKLNEDLFYNGKLLSLDLPHQQKNSEPFHSFKPHLKKKEMLLDNNLNDLSTSSVCLGSEKDLFNCVNVEEANAEEAKPFDGRTNVSANEVEHDCFNSRHTEIKNDLAGNYITNQRHSSDCGEESNSDDHKTSNGCFVVVRVASNQGILENETFQPSQDESVTNLPVIISPDNCYDSDVNCDDNYELNESFCSEFGDSKPLSVSLTETMLENLMKESNLLSDFSRSENTSNFGLDCNRRVSESPIYSQSAQISVTTSESSGSQTSQSSQVPDSFTTSDSKRKSTLVDAPKSKKSR